MTKNPKKSKQEKERQLFSEYPNCVAISIETGRGVHLEHKRMMTVWKYLLSKNSRSKKQSLTVWVVKNNKNFPLYKEWLVSDLYESYKNEDMYVKLFITKHQVFG